MMAAKLLELTPGMHALRDACFEVSDLLRDTMQRLGAPAPGTLRSVAAVARETLMLGEPMPVHVTDTNGALTEALAEPSGRTCWTVKGDWPEVERNAVDYLIDACASSQKYGAAALPSNCAVLELLETCHELELAYRVN